MEKIDLGQYLAGNEYPGRGIAIAKAPDGRQIFIGYWIMGRSANSRNRVFEVQNGLVRTTPYDASKVEDPSLIIYAALRRGVKVTGATVHFVNEICDGGEILLQKAVDVLPGDTPESLQLRVMQQAEWKILPMAAEIVAKEIRNERI